MREVRLEALLVARDRVDRERAVAGDAVAVTGDPRRCGNLGGVDERRVGGDVDAERGRVGTVGAGLARLLGIGDLGQLVRAGAGATGAAAREPRFSYVPALAPGPAASGMFLRQWTSRVRVGLAPLAGGAAHRRLLAIAPRASGDLRAQATAWEERNRVEPEAVAQVMTDLMAEGWERVHYRLTLVAAF